MDTPNLTHIADALRPLAVPLSSLTTDPANVRLHPERNLSSIIASLRAYGQRKPIVVNKRTNHIEAGNGTFAAALRLHWSHIAVVYVDDDPNTANGYAIADNRTAELAEWDSPKLIALIDTIESDDAEITRMLSELAKDAAGAVAIPVEEEDGPEIEAMELQPHEHYDYILVLARNTFDWNWLCDKLQLKRVNSSVVRERKKIGLGRAVPAEKLIALLEDKKA